MNGVMVDGLALGIEIKKNDYDYTCGLAKIGRINNDRFINIDNNEMYNIYFISHLLENRMTISKKLLFM